METYKPLSEMDIDYEIDYSTARIVKKFKYTEQASCDEKQLLQGGKTSKPDTAPLVSVNIDAALQPKSDPKKSQDPILMLPNIGGREICVFRSKRGGVSTILPWEQEPQDFESSQANLKENLYQLGRVKGAVSMIWDHTRYLLSQENFQCQPQFKDLSSNYSKSVEALSQKLQVSSFLEILWTQTDAQFLLQLLGDILDRQPQDFNSTNRSLGNSVPTKSFDDVFEVLPARHSRTTAGMHIWKDLPL